MSRINLNNCIKQMREEAEATKPEVTMESLAFPYATLKATKPQEPSVWVVQNKRGLHLSTVYTRKDADYWTLHGATVTAYYTTTQPCQKFPPNELIWLYTHCRAIGMTCKSDSGKWEEDIALWTINLTERIKELEALSVENIMLDVTPGEDGMGHEIYAKSVKDVESLLTRFSSRIEELEAELLKREGMTCADCNDTGWLENREEGRYPCTCMTEAEPYQLLESERHALKDEIDDIKSHLAHTTSEALKSQHAEWRKDREERDALAMQNQRLREALDGLLENHDPSNQGANCECEPENGYRCHLCCWSNLSEVVEAKAALALPDNTEAIIKRHDAEVLRKAADVCDITPSHPFRPSIEAAHELRHMAAELEKS